MSTPPGHRGTEDRLRSALRSRVDDAPPPPALVDLRERAARPARAEPRPPALRRGLVAAAVAVALAAGIAVALPAGQPGTSSSGEASSVLRRIAVAAATTPPVTVPRPDQFVYTKRVGEAVPRGAPPDYTGPPRPSVLESWIAQDPRAASPVIYDGESSVINPSPPDTDGVTYGPSTYAEFAELPTDSVAMRAYLDETTAGRPFRGSELFLNGTLVPPDVASAFYLALADVPGLTVDPDVVDAVGRPGIGISQVSGTGERLELIFSRDGLRLIGYRSVWTRDDHPSGPGLAQHDAGQVVASYAVVAQAVVDRAGDRPG